MLTLDELEARTERALLTVAALTARVDGLHARLDTIERTARAVLSKAQDTPDVLKELAKLSHRIDEQDIDNAGQDAVIVHVLELLNATLYHLLIVEGIAAPPLHRKLGTTPNHNGRSEAAQPQRQKRARPTGS